MAHHGSDLCLGELAEHGCQSIVVDVTVRLNGHVEDMDGLI